MHKMKGFLACIVKMGIVKNPTIASYWSTLCSQATPLFGKMFTKHRSCHLLHFFHLNNNEEYSGPREADYNLCARYQPHMDHANRAFRHHYTPHQEIRVDESLIGTKNKTSLMQYLPNKHHHRLGTKYWMLYHSVQLLLGVFHIQSGQVSGRQGQHKKNGLGYTILKKTAQD
jgi:hypothetical protein